MNARAWLIAFCFAIVSAVSAAETNHPAPVVTTSPYGWDEISSYRERKMQGWRVFVNARLLADTNLCTRVMTLLDAQLAQIVRVVPAMPLQQLRDIPIWVERSSEATKCAAFHESYEWLRTHGVNPAKTGAIEIGNPENFLSWTKEQPWMIMHELSHGYHKLDLGENQPAILRCYENAKASGKYDSVKYYNGQMQRAYALTNAKEYFAESTEAFFGKNDFQPFDRRELKEFDPEMYETLCKLWQVPDAGR